MINSSKPNSNSIEYCDVYWRLSAPCDLERIVASEPTVGLLARRSITLSKFLSRFVKDESGATAIEYGLIAARVAVVLVTALTAMGTKLSGTFTTVSSKLP